MASRTLAYQRESGLCNSPDPLEEPTVDEEGRCHGVGPHQESGMKPRVPHNAWRHGRLHISVNQACVTALTPWKNPRWMKKGVAMGLVHTRKVVTTDASNTGWGKPR